MGVTMGITCGDGSENKHLWKGIWRNECVEWGLRGGIKPSGDDGWGVGGQGWGGVGSGGGGEWEGGELMLY